jgi:hypothetical protein
VLVNVLHLGLVGLTFDQVVILHILSLLREDEIVINRGLHHVFVDLLGVDLIVSLGIKGQRLGALVIKME